MNYLQAGNFLCNFRAAQAAGLRIVSILLVSLSQLILCSAAAAQQDSAQKPGGELPYSKLSPRAGVFDDGQAALWDLHFLDHFILFGADERARGYKPPQPINFSHVIHVQQNKMECQYCHWTVSKSAYAAIPEVESCMGCHKLVPGKIPEGSGLTMSPEVKKIHDAYNAGEEIAWEKVHVMPDHVRFNHKRHVKAGVTCHECHGQVPAMPVVERVSSMKMGWCISCHRERGTSIDCTVCHK